MKTDDKIVTEEVNEQFLSEERFVVRDIKDTNQGWDVRDTKQTIENVL